MLAEAYNISYGDAMKAELLLLKPITWVLDFY